MGCPTTQKVIYLGVAADCVYTSTYGSQQNATQHIITSFNTASALYKSTFNVSLGIINLDVHDPTYVIDLCTHISDCSVIFTDARPLPTPPRLGTLLARMM